MPLTEKKEFLSKKNQGFMHIYREIINTRGQKPGPQGLMKLPEG